MQFIHAYYDFRVAPLTFDFAWFVAVAASHARRRQAVLSMTLYYPSFRQLFDIEKTYGSGYQHWRLNNIAVRLCHLCPDIYEVISNRSNRVVMATPAIPEGYHPSAVRTDLAIAQMPCTHNDLEAAIVGVTDRVFFKNTDYSASWFQKRFGSDKVVTMSIRRTPHGSQSRNTPLDVWRSVQAGLSAGGYRVVTIPDQDDYLGGKWQPDPRWEEVPEATMDLDLRLALFRHSHGVLGWSGGNSYLLPLCGARFITFGQWNESNPESSRDFLSRKGPPLGTQPLWFDQRSQRYDWKAAGEVTSDYILSVAKPWLDGLEPRGTPT